jgi:hypothetical protein
MSSDQYSSGAGYRTHGPPFFCFFIAVVVVPRILSPHETAEGAHHQLVIFSFLPFLFLIPNGANGNSGAIER